MRVAGKDEGSGKGSKRDGNGNKEGNCRGKGNAIGNIDVLNTMKLPSRLLSVLRKVSLQLQRCLHMTALAIMIVWTPS
jgi:hypothetical protein